MVSEQDIELIEKVLLGRATTEEKQKYRARSQDPDFARSIRILSDLKHAINPKTEQFRKKLEHLYTEYQSKKRHKHLYWLAAAIFVMVGAIALSLVLNTTEPTLDELYVQNFEVPSENISTRESSDTLLAAAIQAYQNENFGEASEYFGSYIDQNPEQQDVVFYLGISKLANGDPSGAVADLSLCASQTGSSYAIPAQWYLSLAYLKLGQLDDAKNYLKEITGKKGKYAIMAKDLLEKLEFVER